jgi:hypothetical protein
LPKYRVTLRVSSVEVVEAPNPYMAAVVASERHGSGVEVAEVRLSVGRPPASSQAKPTASKAKKTTKKRRPVSPEVRAKLAQNLTKARAARAKKLKAAKKSAAKKTTAKKRAKR